jgi:hypothetical protein
VTVLQNVDHKGVDTMSVMAAHLSCPVDDAYRGFTYITLSDTASVSTNQQGDRVQNFKVSDL